MNVLLPGTMDELRTVRGVGSHLVVVDDLGQPPAPRWFSRRFGQLCKAAGVPVIHAHSTRHTLAYFMDEQGIKPVNAAAYLGHTTQVFTNIYLRHKLEGVEAAESALGAVFAAAAEA
jgi:integrase